MALYIKTIDAIEFAEMLAPEEWAAQDERNFERSGGCSSLCKHRQLQPIR